MPPATRKHCDFPGCDRGPLDDDGNKSCYVTPEGLPTRAEVMEDIKNHILMAHELPLRHSEAEVNKVKADTAKLEAETAKLLAERPPAPPTAPTAPPTGSPDTPASRGDRRDKIPRPVVDENINESDWSFFHSQWNQYVKGTGLQGPSLVLHLWEACTEPLQRSLHHAGADKEEDMEVLMAKVKQLAVKKRNNLVNIIELHRMGEHRDETVSAGQGCFIRREDHYVPTGGGPG